MSFSNEYLPPLNHQKVQTGGQNGLAYHQQNRVPQFVVAFLQLQLKKVLMYKFCLLMHLFVTERVNQMEVAMQMRTDLENLNSEQMIVDCLKLLYQWV